MQNDEEGFRVAPQDVRLMEARRFRREEVFLPVTRSGKPLEGPQSEPTIRLDVPPRTSSRRLDPLQAGFGGDESGPRLRSDSLASPLRSVARTLWCEGRSLVGRIRFQLCTRQRYFAATDLPFFHAPGTGYLTLHSGTYARNAGIAAMRSKYPWAGSGDELMVLEGWNRAAKWLAYTGSTEGKEMVRALDRAVDFEQATEICQAMVRESGVGDE